MPDTETIAAQETLLHQHRRRLALLLEQQARLGDYTPPHIRLDIQDTQRDIQQIKVQLRTWGVAVEDLPDDSAVSERSMPADPLALLAALPLDTVPDIAPLPAGSRMPLARNPLFVGREADLKQLAATLKGGGTAAIGQIAAATGLGGIGKTNLASEFVHRYGQFFAGGVFWLSFADGASVPAEIAACGVGLDLPGFVDLKLDDQVARVRHLWQEPIPRLLIFDNCEDEALLDEHRPKTGGCHVLVTSRRAHWSSVLNVQALALGVLSREESIALLCKHRPDLAEDDSDLDAIAAELGDLPLALHLAGSYLETYRDDPDLGSPAAVLAELRDARLLEHPALAGEDVTPSPTNHTLHVGRTFALSYERLRPDDALDALAIALLARAGCFASGEPIPRDLLLATIAVPDKAAQRQTSKAVSRLVDLGLLSVGADSALTLHRLLAVFVATTVQGTDALDAVEQTMIERASALNNAGDPRPLLVLQAHLRYIVDTACMRGDERAAYLCNQLGRHLQMSGDLRGARAYLEQGLVISRQILGEMHPNTAMSLNNLGTLLHAQGDLIGARGYLEQGLVISRQIQGEMHPNTARSLNNLGGLLQAQDDLIGAREYLEQALAIQRQVQGEMYPGTAASLNNLGGLLRDMGDLVGARLYYEQALAIHWQVLGEMHPGTATSLNNLGRLFLDLRDLEGARRYVERALMVRQQVLGEMHPETATSLNNLGVVLRAQGDLEEARKCYEQALAIQWQVLGEMHPDTALTLKNLGAVLWAQGDLIGAQRYYERALAIQWRVLGEMHSDTATSLRDLGTLLWVQGDLVGAHLYYEQALHIYKQVFGPDPRTQKIQDALAALDALPQTHMQQIADITQQAEEAIESVLAKGIAEERAALAEQLELLAQEAEDDSEADSPYLVLAAHLRGLIARLRQSDGDDASGEAD